MRSIRILSVLLVLASAACVRRIPSPTEALEEASRAVSSGVSNARQKALAGFSYLLLETDAKKAAELFELALAAEPSEPYALYGRYLLAQRAAQPQAELVAALDLCERAATHPLSVVAAHAIFELAGDAVPLDELILQRAPKILSGATLADTAQLLRGAIASLQNRRGQKEAHLETLKAMGIPPRLSLLGPLTARGILDFDQPTLPERTGQLPESLTGPFGPTRLRELWVPGGRLKLSGEPSGGDGYVLAVDLEAPTEGRYVLRVISTAAHKLYLDGAQVLERRAFERAEPVVVTAAVDLKLGRHRLLARVLPLDGQGTFSLAVTRADGGPSNVAFFPARGPAPALAPHEVHARVPGVFPKARQLEQALEPEAGAFLASFIAAKDGLTRDRDGAKALLESLGELPRPAIAALRVDAFSDDRSVPEKVARARATRELETVLSKDPGDVRSLLAASRIALNEARTSDAQELVARARAAGPAGAMVLIQEAFVAVATGAEAKADELAKEALAAQPGLCQALRMRFDLARRRDAIEASEQALQAAAACQGHLSRAAELARARGRMEEAAELFKRQAEGDPSELSALISRVEVLVALRRYDEAIGALQDGLSVWPRNTGLLRRLADTEELAGRAEAALATRERALAIDGGDLTLRRQVERARTGKELLEEYAIDGRAVVADYLARPGSEDATSAYVLDAATVRVYPDGSMVDRIHTIQRALDQSGVASVAEVNLPPGAYVLRLRTLKADGRVLEPERIEGKESVSLPGVQVGDFVESEFLLAHSSRGPAQPGFVASTFYFQVFRQPDHWASYRVIAPKGTGMKVDAHNLEVAPIKVEGPHEVFFHEARNMPAYIPEPGGAPNSNEYLPFVVVGAGAEGNEGLVSAYADAYIDNGQLTSEVEDFARKAAGGKKGRQAVEALFEAVMQRLQGRDAGLTMSAASSLAQDRGSRLWLLKASLEALGIPARVVAVRTFAADPAPYLFPSETLLPFICLRVQLPEGELWLDPSVRFAPFNALPEQAAGGREAYVLPEPRRPLEKIKTPPAPPHEVKRSRLWLSLSADGALSGRGEESYGGFDGAHLAGALEALSPDQRDQALQGVLARYFPGAEMSKLEVSLAQQVGAPTTVRFEFSAPRFARVDEGGRLVVPSLSFPAYLGQRFLQLGSRNTALFIGGSEGTQAEIELSLPPGYVLKEPPVELTLENQFGRFSRKEKIAGAKLYAQEEYLVKMARVPPELYEPFARFAGEVDLVQARELVLERK